MRRSFVGSLIFGLATLAAGSTLAPGATTEQDHAQDNLAALKRRIVLDYAELVYKNYRETLDRAQLMRNAIIEFLDQPSAARMEAARSTWIEARKAYGCTEVFRFYGGPIDSRKGGVETLINAWPIDEAYIDSVE